MAWYSRARRDLPWRKTTDPYAIWVSEIMLQQTRVETVVPYWERFLQTFPTVGALAEAPLDDVLARWSGLGYYRRARMMHAAAREVFRERRGEWPKTASGLRELSGVGAYTAGAIASIAFGAKEALVDGNVARVFVRIFAIEEDVRAGAGLARTWAIARALVPEQSGDWNQALMELGATVCTPREPKCASCPAKDLCEARARGLERDLPRLAAKKAARVVARAALVAKDRGKVLLARRRADGLFGGLWEPPGVDVTSNATRDLEALLGARLAGADIAGTVTHVLSHRRMEVTVLRARVRKLPRESTEYDAFAWTDESTLDARGLSTLARKILAAAEKPPGSGTRPR